MLDKDIAEAYREELIKQDKESYEDYLKFEKLMKKAEIK